MLVVLGVAAMAALASCSSDDAEDVNVGATDGGTDAATVHDGADAQDQDGSPSRDGGDTRDAAWFDGGPLPVDCSGAGPCATALVTTLGASASDLGEGFCALLHDGTVACWGANLAGQLGRGDQANAFDSATPARVVGVENATQIDHTCVRTATGEVFCWGTGPFLRGDAGAASTERTALKLPLPPVTRVAAGADVACALADDGLLCWGRNTNGQLAPLESTPAYTALPPKRLELPSGGRARDVVLGAAAFVLRDDGETLSWGANPPLARVSPLFPDPHPLPVTLAGISSLDVTIDSACATAGGTGYCWGATIPKVGEIVATNPPALDRALPERVDAPEPLVQIATTRTLTSTDFGDPVIRPQRWCAVSATGKVYCWGYNASGQAGDGTKSYAFEAKLVQGLPAPAVTVKTTPSTTCALLTTGRVHCWGANFYGQLGNGKIKVPSLTPQEVMLP
ncbi:hypothetical protein AKJ09_09337 [Labilithrix luteola]|uniref:BNR repeat domain protein n=1 Tax=Labilithrix luteola TaxID=1391654 RepID=A0A0K1QAA3_9BACT|nr:hypothetical protein [Labilithrix luteola]AKV02674.1 hypothetical protein AKJ09_09337 [Labilithrix luteola]